MLYQWHEMGRQWMAPWVHLADASSRIFSDPNSWLSTLPGAERISAYNELMHRLGKDYEKPAWDIGEVEVDGHTLPVIEQEIIAKPFCRLLRFKRFTDDQAVIAGLKAQPAVLVVAPLSGHHATLLRDTVRTLLRDHKVYVTEWIDARLVPAEQGGFGLEDYVAYIQDFIRHIGADKLHVMSVCQPTVPVLAAVSLMASAGETTPRSLVMMGGPIDARVSPTQVNDLATRNPLSWFEQNVIHTVPVNYPGHGRAVYPGFLQHAGFIAMNPSRHFQSHWDFYADLVKGDLEDADAHRRFYDEYNAVLDMPAEFYLDTIRVVFQEFLLPRGLWTIDGVKVDPSAITGTALLSIEGELDDIAGLGQTKAAHGLCTGIPKTRRKHITVEGAGHYGIFSGRRWRESVYPDVKAFIARYN
ncbi:polyhydroxyalkanoate depolymerase [Pseudoxanthomonas sp. X-1]|uniref:polyhydroxyalkanoate depolymerase n=1 Tax=Pseudoxanthomonas sp. X-1 TaxID=2571115 RepID=UPI000DB78444|nr:polyhydroxyalkanoate depolymerase [Pseudoxanthomonas sp. X-1]PZP58896.1 MAG: polyhydroxyalkanoate depolymerase [Pseudoxanthomonas spadix]TMN18418.1 polyhydroxyalkanoate depolymerase [Pseudoxanthomonas sp. X-1]UAY76630.1 polyhydroxyalkanoate depolymerase [Pseudoxanthomonas sp. X-1]